MADTMKQTIDTFNEQWAAYFRKNRLEWVTSCSDKWMTFAESFQILGIQFPTKKEKKYGVDLIIYTPSGLFYAKMNFQNLGMMYYLRTNGVEELFCDALELSATEIIHFWNGMDFCRYSSFKREIYEILEEERWQEFIVHYADTLKGTYHREENEAWVEVDGVNIDLTKLYTQFRKRKDEENE